MRRRREDSIFNEGLDRGGKMKRLCDFMVGAKGLTLVGLLASALLVACDDHVSVAPREDDSLLSVCDGCESSSSIAQALSSGEAVLLGSSAVPGSSSAEWGRSSSIAPKSSSSIAQALNSSETVLLGSSAESRSSSSSVSLASSSSEKEAVSSSRGTEDIILPNDYNSEMLVKAVPCRNDSTDNCEYGTLTDERDGQTYKTVKIGNLWWMAENLNYAYLQPVADMDSGSFCLNDSLENCEKYGRLYPWAIALGICPSGWHLPWYMEYTTMLDQFYRQSRMLKSTEWDGTDDYGFAALPSSARYSNGKYTLGNVFGGSGDPAWFWTDTKMVDERYSMVAFESETYELALALRVISNGEATLSTVEVNDAFAVRCVKDY